MISITLIKNSYFSTESDGALLNPPNT